MQSLDRTIAWIGNPFFCEQLPAHGFDVVRIPLDKAQMLTFDEVESACGGLPFAAVYGDMSTAPLLMNIEAWPCLTVFHCVDAHIHSWYHAYAQSFDLCSIALLDEIPRFKNAILAPEQLLWLPNFAFDDIQPMECKKTWDVLFVGTVNPRTTPKRYAFLEKLKGHVSGLHVTRGPFRELFPQARLVLNYCELGDLNFRVFEALATGSCLLTPNIGNGQDLFFERGKDLYTYDAKHVGDVVRLIRRCLASPETCKDVAKSGLAKVNNSHRARHRAQAFSRWISSHDTTALIANRLKKSNDIREMHRLLYLHLAETLPPSRLQEDYLRMARPRKG